MTNIYQSIKIEILNIIQKNSSIIQSDQYDMILSKFAIENVKNSKNGHLALNLAMILKTKDNNLESISTTIINEVLKINYIQSAKLFHPGFINITLTKEKWLIILKNILDNKQNFGYSSQPQKDNINIEYISPNLTGPMHSGHQRIADVGYVLSRCLKLNNYNVIEECYFNDDGSQIDKFIMSVYYRYLELNKKNIPQNITLEYLGDYVIDIAQKLTKEYGDSLEITSDEQMITSKSLKIIKDKLIAFFKKLDIIFDVYSSEKHLRETGQIDKAIQILDKYLYHGHLPTLDTSDDDNKTKNTINTDNKLLLFKSSDFGDSQDRTVQKSNGEYTYFGAELAYFLNKFERGFTQLIMIVGHDHIGCHARWHAVVKALNIIFNKKVELKLIFIQLVKYIENDQIMEMSKRKGKFISAEDMVNTLGKEAIRLFMLSSKYSSELKFDFEKVKAAHKDNPVFYIQYAHVRICSIFRKAIQSNIDISYLDNTPNLTDLYQNTELHESEIQILLTLITWPKIINKTISILEPNLIITYMIKLSTILHQLWNTNNYRIIDTNNLSLTHSRLLLIKAIQYVLQSGFKILNIKPLEVM